MPLHDVQCRRCGAVIENHFASPWPDVLLHDDGGELEILWQASSPHTALAHPHQRTVIYRNPKTGDVAYPPSNALPMPQRYRDAGYERVEFEHARDLEQFEREKGVRNEKLWYNSGNGV